MTQTPRAGRFAPGMPVRCEWCLTRLVMDYGTGEEATMRCPGCRDLTVVFLDRLADTDEGWCWA